MNKITETTLPAIGTPMPGGFFAGAIRLDGQRFAVIISPKKFGQIKKAIWIDDYKDVPGAKSYNDGLANTLAMAEAGSKLAQQARALTIDGLSDFYIPSQDELEVLYRAFKPTADENWCSARSGINLSADVPTYPYTPEFPAQTALDTFKAGGEEAFETEWHWSSTQHAGKSDGAWFQGFSYGVQGYYYYKYGKVCARAVRRQPI
jgi:hypothetical protein